MPAPTDGPISNYNLFGETHDLPDVMHCEAIAARAPLHDWELRPHRHARLHQVLVVASGGGRMTLEGETHPIHPRSFANIPTGVVHGFAFEPGTRGWVVTLPSELLDELAPRREGLQPILARAFRADADAAILLVARRVEREFGGLDFARAQILRSLSGLLLGLVARAGADDAPTGTTSAAPLVARFERLLEENFRRRWTVADYARALAVTPTHLTRVLRAAIGTNASDAIRERAIREARRYLAYTNLPISHITFELGWDDPAHFSRVFSAATGTSPKAFRARLQARR